MRFVSLVIILSLQLLSSSSGAMVTLNSSTAHASIHVSVIIPAFCKLTSKMPGNSLSENEVSLTCNDPSAKVLQLEGGLAKLDTNANCSQPTASLVFYGKIIDQRIFICGQPEGLVRLTVTLGL
ncbi:MAG: hypothetical protein ACK5RO_04160 [Pseudobdellovibrionaceae bacterium]